VGRAMKGKGVEHPDRGPLGQRRQGPRRTERCTMQTQRPDLILAASDAVGTLGGSTPLPSHAPPRLWGEPIAGASPPQW
jgi:hypothetical protein